MNEQITKPKSALALMAERCAVDAAKLHETLKSTVFKGATDEEMLALVVTANTYGLNPLLKELYAFPKKGGGITPMVGVDGWLKIANRQPNFDGMQVEVYGDGATPTHATCEIFLKDRSRSIKITEYFEECRRNTEPWNQMPRRMLRIKAMIQCIRVAFGIGGIHDEDEAHDIASPRNVTPAKPMLRDRPAINDAEVAHEEIKPSEEMRASKPPEGKQKKTREQRMATLTGITERTGNGKTWWAVGLQIGKFAVEMTTFSESMHRDLRDCEIGSRLWITFTKSEKGFALEEFVLQLEEEGGLV